MSLAGYLLCKVGTVRLDKDRLVSVVVTPVITASGLAIDPKYRISVYVDPLDRLINDLLQKGRRLVGLFPETALALLLACRMGGARFKLYAVKEAGGQEPATIFSAMQMDLRPLYEEMSELELTDDKYRERIARIAETSLNANLQGLEKTLATRFSLLLYEVLSRARAPEDFVNVVNREYLSLSLFRARAKSVEDRNLQYIVESGVRVGSKIWSSLLKAEAS